MNKKILLIPAMFLLMIVGAMACENLTGSAIITEDTDICPGIHTPSSVKIRNSSILIQGLQQDGYCYQEQTNETTITEDGVCGLKYDGSYVTDQVSSDFYYYINYSKPPEATNLSEWVMKTGVGTENVTLDETCFTQSPDHIALRVELHWDGFIGSNETVKRHCWNGATWTQIGTTVTDDNPSISATGSNSGIFIDGLFSTGNAWIGSGFRITSTPPDIMVFEEAMNWYVKNIPSTIYIVGGGSVEFESTPYDTFNSTLFNVGLKDVELILDGLGNHTVTDVEFVDSVITGASPNMFIFDNIFRSSGSSATVILQDSALLQNNNFIDTQTKERIRLNSDNIYVFNNNISCSNGYECIFQSGRENNTATQNTFNIGDLSVGFSSDNSLNVIVNNNIFKGLENGDGIGVSDQNSNNPSYYFNNTFDFLAISTQIENSPSVVIEKNIISNGTGIGGEGDITLDTTSINSLVIDNVFKVKTVSGTGNTHIFDNTNSGQTQITNNTFESCLNNMCYWGSSLSQKIIRNNTFTNAGGSAVYLIQGNNNLIDGNDFTTGTGFALNLQILSGENTTVSNNVAEGSGNIGAFMFFRDDFTKILNNILTGFQNSFLGAITNSGASNSTLLINNGENKIVWNNTNIQLIDPDSVILGNNIVALNSSLETDLNTLAHVVLTNLTDFDVQPTIFTIPEFTSNRSLILANETKCNPPQCTNLVWNNATKTLEFDVASWSSLTASNVTVLGNFNIEIRDEDTNNLILEDGTLKDITSTATQFFFTNTGTFNIGAFQLGLHRFDVSATSYPARSNFYTVSTSADNLTLYLLNSSKGNNVKFNIIDSGSSPVEDADLIFTKFVDSAFRTVQHENTGVLGFVNAFLNPNTIYRIMISAPCCTSRTIDIEPTESEFTIVLQQTSVVDFDNFLFDIEYLIDPFEGPLVANETQSFDFTTSSAGGQIDYFTVSSFFNNATVSNTVSGSPAGGTAGITLNTTLVTGNSVDVTYTLKAINSTELLVVNKTYLILGSITPTSTSVAGISPGITNSLGTTWSSILAIFLSVAIGLTFVTFIGPVGAGILAILTLIGFSIVGWISSFAVLIPMILVFSIYLATGRTD